MRQECGWFDDDDHSSGALSARLTGDAANLQGVNDNKLSFFIIFNFIYLFIQALCQFNRSLVSRLV